jgi:sialic acid synthase SpsE
MHCNCAYPTPDVDANLNNIKWLEAEFGLPVGYSDHTLGTKACELAVAIGARALEKHFTYRKEDQIFHDHQLSADPEEMRDLVVRVRQAETYLGNSSRVTSPSEQGMEVHMRRSIGALVDIPAGVKIERSWLTWVRPAWGLRADQMEMLVGKTLNKNLGAGKIVRKEDLSN